MTEDPHMCLLCARNKVCSACLEIVDWHIDPLPWEAPRNEPMTSLLAASTGASHPSLTSPTLASGMRTSFAHCAIINPKERNTI